MTTYATIHQLLAREFVVSPAEIRPNTALRTLGLRQPDMATLAAALTRRFAVAIDATQLTAPTTLLDIEQLIERASNA